MRSTLKVASRLFFAVAAIAVAACGGDSGGSSTGPSDPAPGPSAPAPGPSAPAPGPSAPAPAPGSITGSHALTQVRTLGNLGGGGSGLPVTFVDGSGDHLVFQSGTLTLGEDNRFDLKIQVTFNGSSSELTDYGTYTASEGGVIDFDSEKSTPRVSNALVYDDRIMLNGQVGGIPFEFDVQR
jgi:hypothetical protein